jgi:hypothetical protein
MSINPLIDNLTINEIMNKAIKYELKAVQNRKYVNAYQKRKIVEKDEDFLKKHREYSKSYYEKNKEKVNKKQLERYHNKKKPILSEEVK